MFLYMPIEKASVLFYGLFQKKSQNETFTL
jgi:hypothetical protein